MPPSVHTRSRPRRPDRAPDALAEGRQLAALKRKLLEDLSWIPVPWAGPSDDRDGWGVAVGAPLRGGANGGVADRQGGRNLPLFWNELDLRGFRVLSRHLCESNDFAIGFSGLLTNYHVRKGYGWQACRRGAHKGTYQTAGALADPLVGRAQQILDAWRDAVKWPVLSREAFRRWRRDGECCGRFFARGWHRLPEFRFVDPSQIGHPTGDTAGDESFGIETPAGDPAGDPVRFHVWDHDEAGRGEWVDADRVVFAKANVDSDVKRGLPDFFPAAEALDGAQRLVHTMLATAIRQARVAWREKFPTSTAAQVQGLTPVPSGPPVNTGATTSTPESLPWWYDRGQRFGVNGFKRSDVVRVEGSREFEAGPTMAGASSYVAVEQAALRACGVRWSMPEYFSGDASNNNMASSFVANSPFVTAVECSQEEWAAAWERPIALKVLACARDAGLLSWGEWSQLDVETTAAAVATPEPDRDAQRLTGLIGAKVMCLDTARQQLGLDPQHEAEGVLKDARAAQAGQPPQGGAGGGMVGESRKPCGCSELVHESDEHQGATGKFPDKNGNEYCLQDGKHVKCPEEGEDASEPGAGGGASVTDGNKPPADAKGSGDKATDAAKGNKLGPSDLQKLLSKLDDDDAKLKAIHAADAKPEDKAEAAVSVILGPDAKWQYGGNKSVPVGKGHDFRIGDGNALHLLDAKTRAAAATVTITDGEQLSKIAEALQALKTSDAPGGVSVVTGYFHLHKNAGATFVTGFTEGEKSYPAAPTTKQPKLLFGDVGEWKDEVRKRLESGDRDAPFPALQLAPGLTTAFDKWSPEQITLARDRYKQAAEFLAHPDNYGKYRELIRAQARARVVTATKDALRASGDDPKVIATTLEPYLKNNPDLIGELKKVDELSDAFRDDPKHRGKVFASAKPEEVGKAADALADDVKVKHVGAVAAGLSDEALKQLPPDLVARIIAAHQGASTPSPTN